MDGCNFVDGIGEFEFVCIAGCVFSEICIDGVVFDIAGIVIVFDDFCGGDETFFGLGNIGTIERRIGKFVYIILNGRIV